MKKTFLTILFLIIIFSINSQGMEDFAVHIQPGVDLPIGPKSSLFADDGLFKVSGTISLRGQYKFASLPFLYIEGLLQGGIHPTFADTLSITSAGLGLGADFRVADVLSLQTGLEGGISLGLYEGQDVATNPFFGGKLGLIWDITPSLGLSLGGTYDYHLGWDQTEQQYTDLYQGASIWLGGVFRFKSDTGRQKIEIDNIDFDPVFPVFYSHYAENPLGQILIKNHENSSISNVDVYFYAGEYMEQPMLSKSISKIGRDEEITVDILSLFSNRILQLTENSKVSSEITVEYSYLGERFSYTKPYTLKILDRNSMTWDDDRKAASFVTPRDPTVLLFSKNTAGLVREQGNNPLNLNFRIAMCLFETLRLYGMNYVIDPQSSYIEASQDQLFLDYLQFPSLSLTFLSVDCDDLLILSSALLESVGINTAFITIPGHIYTAFSLDITEAEARREFTNTNDFIFIDDNTWVPVEATLMQEGFLKAYRTGAKQWRDHTNTETAALYPIYEAWEHYQPVSFSTNALSLLFPSADSIIESYNVNLNAFVTQDIQEKVDYFSDRIQRRGDNATVRNRFGILYARYGLLGQAEDQFNKALDHDNRFTSALLNMGNIAFLKEQYSSAEGWYEEAFENEPENPLILAGLARTRFEMENFEQAQKDYFELELLSPEIASNYAYIGNTNTILSRASAAKDKGKTFWDEEFN